MATTTEAATEMRFVLSGVSWQFYEACLAEIGDRRVRVSYYRGDIEMMSPSEEHDRFAYLLGRLIEIATLDLDIPIRGVRSTTWRREDQEAGLEPDECYYIEHEPQVRGKRTVDLAVDPPPDLAIEVEISRSAVKRMAIYAALGVPEVWRFDGQTLSIHLLGDDGSYHQQPCGRNLPMLPPEDLSRFLAARDVSDETTWIRSFRKWVREHVLPQWEEG
jgi:Uma2 family endonuclease